MVILLRGQGAAPKLNIPKPPQEGPSELLETSALTGLKQNPEERKQTDKCKYWPNSYCTPTLDGPGSTTIMKSWVLLIKQR